MNALVKLGASTVALMVLASVAALLTLPPTPHEEQLRRQAESQRLVDRLTVEIWNYYHDHGEFPYGNGEGSAELVLALRSPGKNGLPYLQFARENVTDLGDLRNPVSPWNEVFYYRNNRLPGGGSADVHNTLTFDLWGRDAQGRDDGVNNWK